jgi:purine-binding chemotaxis protein CheW
MTMPDSVSIPWGDQAAIDAKLTDRARQLAEIPPPADHSRAIEVLVCRLGVEEYAVELRLLRGVYPAIGLTPVPCTPPFVAGLLNLRGEILTVLDLGVAMGLAGSDQHEVLLAETPRVRVGLLVGEVLGVRRIALDSLDRALAGSDSTRGIAEARTVLLDLEALLADRRFEA